nr:MAG: hypothetical protein DIU57_18075 [Pseudomonadota bacterium]
MGRRSRHTAEELRELAIQSAHQIIAENGLAGISARAIARRIGYSAGTLYNIFGSLDELVLEVEGLLLEALDRRLSQVAAEGPSRHQLNKLARAYLSFSRENEKVWSIVAQRVLPFNKSTPPWYSERLERLSDHFEDALASQLPEMKNSPKSLKQSARVVWAALHGISLMSATRKLPPMCYESVQHIADDLIETYLAGLQERSNRSRPSA